MPKVTGRQAAKIRLQQPLGRQQIEAVSRALFTGGDMIRAEAGRLITDGAVSGKFHVPSKPGEPPNEDTGHLRSNIKVEQPAPLRVLVTSNARYAVPLEAGTSKMAARPYMRPACRNKRKEVVAVVRRAVSAATTRKGK
jgi:HK97 gp10 family phage protein